jgi:hypothetical protein
MVYRCRILHSLYLLLAVLRHRAVLPLHQAQNRHREVRLPEKVRHLRQLLITQTIHRQISLLRKVVAVNPEQAKLKQPVIATAKQDLA